MSRRKRHENNIRPRNARSKILHTTLSSSRVTINGANPRLHDRTTVSTRILRTLRTEPCYHAEAEEEPLRNRDLCRNPHGRIQCGRKLRDIRCHCLSRRGTAPNDRPKSFLRPYRTESGDQYRVLHAPESAPGSLPDRPHRAAAGFPEKRPPSDSPIFRSRTAKKRIREGIIVTVF